MNKIAAPPLRENSRSFLKFFLDTSCVRFKKYSRHGTKQTKAIKYQERKGVKDKLRSSYAIGKFIVISIDIAANLKAVFLPYFTAKVLIFTNASAS